MSKSRKLHAILTVIAVLLAAQIWLQVASRPVFAGESQAAGDPPTFPNAAKQRQDLLDAVERMTNEVKRTNELLESSTLQVEVANLSEIKEVANESGE